MLNFFALGIALGIALGLGLIILVAILRIYAKKELLNLKKTVEKITDENDIVEIDEKNNIFILNKKTFKFTIFEIISRNKYKVYETSIKNVMSVELIEDNNSIIKTDRGSQAVGAITGGLLLGGVGAIVGGVTGSKKSITTVTQLKVTILFNDINHMVSEIIYIDYPNGIEKNEINYKDYIERAKKWTHAIEILMKNELIEDFEPIERSAIYKPKENILCIEEEDKQ